MAVTTSDPVVLLRTEHAVSRLLADAAGLLDPYPALLEALGSNLGWQLGAVWEPASDGLLHCVATWHDSTIERSAFEDHSRRMPLESGEGLPGRVWWSAAPAWIGDLASDANFPRAEAAARAGLRAGFCFPVLAPHGIEAAFEFFTHETREPDQTLIDSAANLGRQIGQFLDRRRAEESLRESEARTRAVLEAALDCIVAMDDRGRVIEFNPAAERTFGYSRDEVVGRDMAELIIPPSLRPHHRRAFERHLQTDEARILDRRLEITGMRADGSEFPVELTITRIRVPGNRMFTGYLRDITERKRAEEELRASRARIVEASDSERRRIERNLHDGAQQQLVAIALNLRLARSRLDGAGEEAAELIDQSMRDLEQATAELRELARGIHPAVLTDRGLAAAVGALAARSSVPVDPIAVDVERLPSAIEAAAYYVVAEALTNVARYANATHAEVAIAQPEPPVVTVEVRDDGVGGADPSAGSGLRGLADRVATVGGELEVSSPAGAGTLVRARLPCEL